MATRLGQQPRGAGPPAADSAPPGRTGAKSRVGHRFDCFWGLSKSETGGKNLTQHLGADFDGEIMGPVVGGIGEDCEKLSWVSMANLLVTLWENKFDSSQREASWLGAKYLVEVKPLWSLRKRKVLAQFWHIPVHCWCSSLFGWSSGWVAAFIFEPPWPTQSLSVLLFFFRSVSQGHLPEILVSQSLRR